jgi:hypothetical protein
MNCFKLTSTLCLGTFMLAVACGDPPKTDETGESSSTSGTSAGTQPTEGVTETSAADSSTTDVSGTVGESMTMGESSSSTGPDTGVTTGTPACPDEENQDNNAECTDASGCGCKSGNCFLVPILGGWCGECLSDEDCAPGGCTVPNPIAGTGSVCNMGEPGQGCMSDAVCTDPDNLSCGTLLEVPGIITVSTCGECLTNEECVDMMLPNCSPQYDVMNFTGKLACVADFSVPQDGGCNLADDGMGEPVGNQACYKPEMGDAHGFCGDADVMGLLHVGICGECNSNADCMQGETCTDPVVDLMAGALVGSVCQ